MELGVRGLAEKSVVPYFFCLAREFWNQTCVTLLLSPVSCAIRSRSCPSGLESMLKFAWRIWSCSSVKVVRTRLVLWHLIIPPLDGESSLSASDKEQTLCHKGRSSKIAHLYSASPLAVSLVRVSVRLSWRRRKCPDRFFPLANRGSAAKILARNPKQVTFLEG